MRRTKKEWERERESEREREREREREMMDYDDRHETSLLLCINVMNIYL